MNSNDRPCIIYARFSPRPERASDTCNSIRVQIDRCRAYCLARGWTAQEPPCIDENASGATADRKGYQDAVERATAARGILLAYSLSRLTRDVEQAHALVRRLSKAGACIASVTEPIDTSTAVGRLVFGQLALISAFQREDTAEKTRDSHLSMQGNGKRVSKEPPYGWKLDADSPPNPDSGLPSGLVMDDHEQGVIYMIQDWRKQGKTLREICRLLEHSNMDCRGNGWHHQTIVRILSRYEVH